MAKVSRSVLKEIVKECLVEILSEGLSTTEDQLQERARARKKPSSTKSPNKISSDVFTKRNKMLKDRTSGVLKNINGMTEDPVLRDIFADTAATTLLEQKTGEGQSKTYSPGDAAAKVVHENNLDDLFEGSQNWAALAFNGGKK